MKITMYELLGMVKDGKAPKKVKYKNKLYFLQHYCNGEIDYTNEDNLDEIYHLFNEAKVNDTVEIIEEEKKIPEKLSILQFSDLIDMSKEELIETIKEQRFKINEIIDYLKSKGE